MKVKETPLPGLMLIEPDVYPDSRGYFFESYNWERFRGFGIHEIFIQDNESLSVKGVIRGLHYQLEPFSQSKLVRVIVGAVFDVAVDLRSDSPTFGRWFGVELSGDNKFQMLIPKGFAHGLSVLSPTALFAYKCDQLYNRSMERSLRFDDPELNIDWKIPLSERIISDKDMNAPFFADSEYNFSYP